MWFPPPPVLGVCTCCELPHKQEATHLKNINAKKQSKAKTTASLFTCSTDSFPFSLRCQTLGTTTCQTQQSFQALRVGREREAGMGGGGGSSSSSSSSSPGRCWREWGGGCCMSLQVFKRLRMLYPYSLGRNSRALLAFHSTRWRLFERPEKRVSGTSSSGRLGARKLRKHKMGGTSEESTGEREREEEKERRGERERERGSWKIINYPQQVLLCATKAQMHYQVLLRLNLKRSQTLLSGLRGGRSVFLACSPLHHLTCFFLEMRYIRGLPINVMEMVLSQETQEPKFCLSALLHLSISLIFN